MFIWDYLLKSITKCMRFSYEKNYWDFGTKELHAEIFCNDNQFLFNTKKYLYLFKNFYKVKKKDH